MKKYNTIILAAAVIICACTKDIEYKGPDSERMLIVNSITKSGNIPMIRMSHSAFFLDSYYSGTILNDVTVQGCDICLRRISEESTEYENRDQ